MSFKDFPQLKSKDGDILGYSKWIDAESMKLIRT